MYVCHYIEEVSLAQTMKAMLIKIILCESYLKYSDNCCVKDMLTATRYR